ncbi:amidohydrolase family protein [Cyclobacterium marinum]|uniref:amidohydrolase family protein n=1 Tax=Cyclobacterium marinum TaxID=104 RepID=UPI0030D7ECD3|tara:strand:- start:200962 stop:202644 length:1683 start_codon:yes stop_codon:yes gene_type:complete
MKSKNQLILPYFTAILLGLLINTSLSQAQSDNNGSKRVTTSYFLSGATIIPYPGKILSEYDILFKNGVIVKIGKNLQPPSNAKEINGKSLFVYPGFIDFGNKTGVQAPELPEKPSNFDTSNPSPEIAGIHPHFSSTKHYKFDENLEEEWRKLGFSMGQKLPEGQGMLPGSTAVVIYGNAENNNLLSSVQSQYFQFSTIRGLYPHTKLAVMAKWRDLYQNTVLYQESLKLYEKNKHIGRIKEDPVLDALIPVTQNSKSLLVLVNSELDQRRAIKMKDENNLKLILLGVNEGSSVIPLIKSKEIGVVLSLDLPKDNFTDSLPKTEQGEDYDALIKRGKNAYQEALSLASKYEKENIPFAFSSLGVDKKDLFKNISLMIENGLSKEAALAALTTNPAKLLGIDEISGSISPGKMANMVVMTDSLFTEEGKVKMVISDGYLFDYSEDTKLSDAKSQVWNYAAETPVGQSKGTWEFFQKDNKWEGTVSYDSPKGTGNKKSEMKDLVKTEEGLSFSFTVETNEEVLEVTVSGDIDQNKFDGKMNIKGYSQFIVKASKEEKPNKNHE